MLKDKQIEYNLSAKKGKLKLVFFDFAVEHILRIARVLNQGSSHIMLIGVGGSGKKSLARLASFMMGCEVFEITLTKNYNLDKFH